MKRQFSIFDGLFLLALYFKLSGSGPALSWFDVFAPYLVEAVTVLIGSVFTLFNVKDRLKFRLWQWAMNLRVKWAGKAARAFMAEQNAKTGQAPARKVGGNPGQFVDPANKGR